MPIYEYQCQACGHQFETTQRITEDPLKDCPSCNAPQLQRLISATAFMLKGGGWYKDGYGKPVKEQRSDSQVADRLTKAINDDKKKTAEAATSGASESSSSSSAADSGGTASTPTSGGASSTPSS